VEILIDPGSSHLIRWCFELYSIESNVLEYAHIGYSVNGIFLITSVIGITLLPSLSSNLNPQKNKKTKGGEERRKRRRKENEKMGVSWMRYQDSKLCLHDVSATFFFYDG